MSKNVVSLVAKDDTDKKKALDAANTALKQAKDKLKAAGDDAAKAAAQKEVDAAKAKVAK